MLGIVGRALVVFVMAGTPTADVHEEAILESRSSAVSPGDTILVDGREFEAGEAYVFKLLGVLAKYELPGAIADDEGRFSLKLTIPLEVRPGAYEIVAIAPDGDVAARLEIAVLEATAGTAPAPVSETSSINTQVPARSDEIIIERRRSSLEWGVIGLVIGLAAGLGFCLLRRAPAP